MLGFVRILRLSSLALAAAFAFPAGAAEIVVTDLRVGLHDQTTRLVIDLSKRVEFKVFTLDNPYRVVIDLPEVGWRLPAKPLPGRTGLLERLRYGLFKPGQSRLVLDILGPASIDKAFVLKPVGALAYRLIVDLKSIGRKAFLKGLGKPALVAVTATPRLMPPSKPAAAPSKPRKRVLAIDPGHGGVDPGATGVSGIYEKRLNLTAAREFKIMLEKTGRYRVVLTRGRDIFLRLRDRVAKSRAAGAELFISLHADVIKNKKIRGLSVYTLSEKASDKEAAALAEKENKADLIAGLDLSNESPVVTNILIDLAQRETMNDSSRFAAMLIKELGREVKILRNTHRFAGFAVLKAPDVPSVLLELGFLSNRHEEKALRSKAYRAKLGAALVRGVDQYFARIEEANSN
jgi:N-acetylmuramoyl-L-alanine amidase